MSATILFDAVTAQREKTFAFDVWYANHYLEQLRASAPTACVRRYVSAIRGEYVALLGSGDHAASMRSSAPEHPLVASHERFIGEYIGGRAAAGVDDRIVEADILYPVFFRVPAAREHEFNRWYQDEHMELLLRCPYWRMCRRYRIRDAGDGFTHVALHYLTDLRALESRERDLARSTPWRDRLAAEAWFKGEYRVYMQWGGRLVSTGTAG